MIFNLCLIILPTPLFLLLICLKRFNYRCLANSLHFLLCKPSIRSITLLQYLLFLAPYLLPKQFLTNALLALLETEISLRYFSYICLLRFIIYWFLVEMGMGDRYQYFFNADLLLGVWDLMLGLGVRWLVVVDGVGEVDFGLGCRGVPGR